VVVSRQHTRTVVVLAAGEGKRMRSALPKVLHPLLGRTLLGHVLAAADALAADRTLVVVGAGGGRRDAGRAARHRPRGPGRPRGQ
jgi:bifunctional UDP-N-acetylglucosamine pyrophosphorylase/glucosamine-1-phosphate N-acetyltransferase